MGTENLKTDLSRQNSLNNFGIELGKFTMVSQTIYLGSYVVGSDSIDLLLLETLI